MNKLDEVGNWEFLLRTEMRSSKMRYSKMRILKMSGPKIGVTKIRSQW